MHIQVIGVSAARSSYAKDYEHSSPGRSPDSWLQTLFVWPSHPLDARQWLVLILGEHEKLTSYSSATASDSHRLPYSARASGSGHPMTTVGNWLDYSADTLL
jgi:hypothetical protein